MLRATSILLLLLSSASSSAEERIIYRCVTAGVQIYSDKPCGPAAEVYSRAAGAVTAAAPNAAPASAASKPKPAARRPRPVEPKDPTRADCERLQVQLERLRSRMRTGYRAAEGERLRDQERAARARVRELRCRA